MEKDVSTNIEPEELLQELEDKTAEISRLRQANEKLESILAEGLKATEEEGRARSPAVNGLRSQIKWLQYVLQTERRDHLEAIPLAKEVKKLRRQVTFYRQTIADTTMMYKVLLEEKQQIIEGLIETHNVLAQELNKVRKKSAGRVPKTREAAKRSNCIGHIDQARYTFLKKEVTFLRRRLAHIQSAKPAIDKQIKLLSDENATKDRYIAHLQEAVDILKCNEMANTHHTGAGIGDYFLGVSAQKEVNHLARLLDKTLFHSRTKSDNRIKHS